MNTDLPEGYRWATEVETEAYNHIQNGNLREGAFPGARIIKRTADAEGNPYTQGESDLAVPLRYTAQEVNRMLNEACDEVIALASDEDGGGLDETGTIDALNLLVNVTSAYANQGEFVGMEDVIAINYSDTEEIGVEAMVDQVRSWILS